MRLGKRERYAKRVLFTEFRDFKQAVVEANLTEMRQARRAGVTLPSSKGYGSKDFKATMTHGLYRGLYDAEMSTVLDTGRGLKPAKAKTVRAANAGPVRSKLEGTL